MSLKRANDKTIPSAALIGAATIIDSTPSSELRKQLMVEQEAGRRKAHET
jgi:hypothetical protein